MRVKSMKIIIGLFIVIAASQFDARSQTISTDSLVRKFDRYREKALQEKIYAHIDQAFHLTGETLWFKIYSVDGSLHQPIGISNVAYAELVNAADEPVLQAKVELKNGVG